jgi:His/Glu/Gln/Arg/opine family amino acid ABC transporter permease subunit
MRQHLLKISLFIIMFGIIVSLVPNNDASDSVQDEFILDVVFYSSYNNQTLTQDKLNNINLDFYLPVYYENTKLSYELNSEYLKLSDEVETISLRTNDGYIDKDVYHVEIIKSPSIWKQKADFKIILTANDNDLEIEQNYTGQIIASIPDDFIGGTIYTVVKYSQMFLDGSLKTLTLALTGTIVGFVLALVLASMKLLHTTEQDNKLSRLIKKTLNQIANIYITVFRGTPMIVQASFFWYGFGLFGNPFYCGLFVVSINTAAYIAEIIRGGIQSIDKGQTEAAYALGMNHIHTMIYVIIPQAIKNAFPAIGNEFIVNIKDTAVLSIIGIFELFNQGRKITGMHYRQLEVYFIVAVVYLFLTYTVSSILKKIEIRMDLQPLEITSSN